MAITYEKLESWYLEDAHDDQGWENYLAWKKENPNMKVWWQNHLREEAIRKREYKKALEEAMIYELSALELAALQNQIKDRPVDECRENINNIKTGIDISYGNINIVYSGYLFQVKLAADSPPPKWVVFSKGLYYKILSPEIRQLLDAQIVFKKLTENNSIDNGSNDDWDQI